MKQESVDAKNLAQKYQEEFLKTFKALKLFSQNALNQLAHYAVLQNKLHQLAVKSESSFHAKNAIHALHQSDFFTKQEELRNKLTLFYKELTLLSKQLDKLASTRSCSVKISPTAVGSALKHEKHEIKSKVVKKEHTKDSKIEKSPESKQSNISISSPLSSTKKITRSKINPLKGLSKKRLDSVTGRLLS